MLERNEPTNSFSFSRIELSTLQNSLFINEVLAKYPLKKLNQPYVLRNFD